MRNCFLENCPAEFAAFDGSESFHMWHATEGDLYARYGETTADLYSKGVSLQNNEDLLEFGLCPAADDPSCKLRPLFYYFLLL